MMFGSGGGWAVLLYGVVLLWIPLGPFIMGASGAWCARPPGRRRTAGRVCSLLVPALTVGAPATVLFNVFNPSGAPPNRQDVVAFLGVYVFLLTVLPWALGWGIARVVRARRRQRLRRQGSRLR